MQGRVYDTSLGLERRIAYASVALITCNTTIPTLSGSDGVYRLTALGEQINPCQQVAFEVTAAGYVALRQYVAVSSLWAQPWRDWGLSPFTPTPTGTGTINPSSTPTATGTPSATGTVSPTVELKATPTSTASATATPTATTTASPVVDLYYVLVPLILR